MYQEPPNSTTTVNDGNTIQTGLIMEQRTQKLNNIRGSPFKISKIAVSGLSGSAKELQCHCRVLTINPCKTLKMYL